MGMADASNVDNRQTVRQHRTLPIPGYTYNWKHILIMQKMDVLPVLKGVEILCKKKFR